MLIVEQSQQTRRTKGTAVLFEAWCENKNVQEDYMWAVSHNEHHPFGGDPGLQVKQRRNI